VLATTTAWKPVHGVYVVLFAATVIVWALAELRQAIKRRPEASRVALGDELVLRLSVAAGALVAALVGVKVPVAAMRPTALAAWLGLVFLWCGVAAWCTASGWRNAPLLRDLGDRYRDYAATRKRLIPYLW
jgi:hypothetical protein